jgi:hypothetical protein
MPELSKLLGKVDRWRQLAEIAKMFGLSEESIKRLAKTHGFPLRRVTPFATPGALGSEFLQWLNGQPRVAAPVRIRRSPPAGTMKRSKTRSPSFNPVKWTIRVAVWPCLVFHRPF